MTRSVERTATDPRPEIVEGSVRGWTCGICGYATAVTTPRCPECRGPLSSRFYDGVGVVWSSTLVRIPVGERTPPYALAYVDLDGGPRILAHVAGESSDPVRIGTRVTVCGITACGDPEVKEVSDP